LKVVERRKTEEVVPLRIQLTMRPSKKYWRSRRSEREGCSRTDERKEVETQGKTKEEGREWELSWVASEEISSTHSWDLGDQLKKEE